MAGTPKPQRAINTHTDTTPWHRMRGTASPPPLVCLPAPQAGPGTARGRPCTGTSTTSRQTKGDERPQDTQPISSRTMRQHPQADPLLLISVATNVSGSGSHARHAQFCPPSSSAMPAQEQGNDTNTQAKSHTWPGRSGLIPVPAQRTTSCHLLHCRRHPCTMQPTPPMCAPRCASPPPPVRTRTCCMCHHTA